MGFLRRSIPSYCVRCLLLLAFITSCAALQAHASAPTPSVDESLLTPAQLADLEMRANAAKPDEQCYLFTDLAHRLTEIAGNQVTQGLTAEAEATFHHIDLLTTKIHAALMARARHLQDAEVLMHHTARRLSDMLHDSSSSERETLLATMRDLDRVHAEVLSQVFAH